MSRKIKDREAGWRDDEGYFEKELKMVKEIDGVVIEYAPLELIPKCPSCKERLPKIWTKRKSKISQDKEMLICPHCEVIIGYGYSVGAIKFFA